MKYWNMKYTFSLILILLSVGVVLSFQNCSNVKLSAGSSIANSLLSGSSTSTLPPPADAHAVYRLMIFVDQSHSMKYRRCENDLDGRLMKKALTGDQVSIDAILHADQSCKDENGGNIDMTTGKPGVDVDQHRYKVISNWINYLTNVMQGVTTAENMKVAIIPFSGGSGHSFARPDVNNNIDVPPATTNDRAHYKYLNFQDAISYLQKLQNEQTVEPHVPPGGKHMGTTVPYKQLENAYSVMEDEFANLAADGNLSHAKFDFVYFTDGVFKPLEEYYTHLSKIIGCDQAPTNCDESYPDSMCMVCKKLHESFTASYGEYSDNNMQAIATTIKKIAKLPTDPRFAGGQINVHLVQLGPSTLIPDDDQPDQVDSFGIGANMFNAICPTITQSQQNVSCHVLEDDKIPFAVHPNSDSMYTFKIAQFYAVNLNAFVNQTGVLVTDSDGDGLPDVQDNNPTQPRSDGYCLDGINQTYGCVHASCDPTLDEVDGGLNQCDYKSFKPKTLTTLSADHDFDNIFNIYEVSRGIDPNYDDSQASTAGDNYLDFQHFYRGVFPQIKVSNVPYEQQIDFDVKYVGDDVTLNASGEKVSTATYSVNLKNMPLVNTLAVPEPPAGSALAKQFYLQYPIKHWNPVTRAYDPPTYITLPYEDMLGPAPHAAGINEILFFVKVQANEDPTFHYWLLRKHRVDALRPGSKINLDLNLQNFHELRYLK